MEISKIEKYWRKTEAAQNFAENHIRGEIIQRLSPIILW